MVPQATTDNECILENSPVSPNESESRVAPRKLRRKLARQAAARLAAGGN